MKIALNFPYIWLCSDWVTFWCRQCPAWPSPNGHWTFSEKQHRSRAARTMGWPTPTSGSLAFSKASQVNNFSLGDWKVIRGTLSHTHSAQNLLTRVGTQTLVKKRLMKACQCLTVQVLIGTSYFWCKRLFFFFFNREHWFPLCRPTPKSLNAVNERGANKSDFVGRYLDQWIVCCCRWWYNCNTAAQRACSQHPAGGGAETGAAPWVTHHQPDVSRVLLWALMLCWASTAVLKPVWDWWLVDFWDVWQNWK